MTHEFEGIEHVNAAVDALHQGDCLRAVVKISPPPVLQPCKIKVTSSVKLEGGLLQSVSHWSESVQGFMNFNVYLPQSEICDQRGKPFPVIYFLSGLGCTQDNAAHKSGFARFAHKHNLAVVFPDTSPRNTNIEGITSDW